MHTREKRKYICQHCKLPFRREVFIRPNGTVEQESLTRYCRICDALSYAQDRRRYYQKREAELHAKVAARIARAALSTTAIALLLLASCAQSVQPMADAGSMEDAPSGALTREQACARFDEQWNLSVEVSSGMNCGAEPACPFEGPGPNVDPAQFDACFRELEGANDCSFFVTALSSLACNGTVEGDAGTESDGGLLDASQLCATGLQRNAELGCGHASGASVDVCPAVWDGTETCDAARSATCIERLEAASTCNELVIAWRGDCLSVGVCDPVSP